MPLVHRYLAPADGAQAPSKKRTLGQLLQCNLTCGVRLSAPEGCTLFVPEELPAAIQRSDWRRRLQEVLERQKECVPYVITNKQGESLASICAHEFGLLFFFPEQFCACKERLVQRVYDMGLCRDVFGSFWMLSDSWIKLL